MDLLAFNLSGLHWNFYTVNKEANSRDFCRENWPPVLGSGRQRAQPFIRCQTLLEQNQVLRLPQLLSFAKEFETWRIKPLLWMTWINAKGMHVWHQILKEYWCLENHKNSSVQGQNVLNKECVRQASTPSCRSMHGGKRHEAACCQLKKYQHSLPHNPPLLNCSNLSSAVVFKSFALLISCNQKIRHQWASLCRPINCFNWVNEERSHLRDKQWMYGRIKIFDSLLFFSIRQL